MQPPPPPAKTSMITFASDEEINVMNADGSDQTRRTNNSGEDSQAAWSRDGSKIAFRNYSGLYDEIYVMNADGSGQARLTNNSVHDFHPAWGPLKQFAGTRGPEAARDRPALPGSPRVTR